MLVVIGCPVLKPSTFGGEEGAGIQSAAVHQPNECALYKLYAAVLNMMCLLPWVSCSSTAMTIMRATSSMLLQCCLVFPVCIFCGATQPGCALLVRPLLEDRSKAVVA